MRRDYKAVLAAHAMDPNRRELYVEGISDRAFFEWLAGDAKNPNARILTIATVDVPPCAGGERGRLIYFAGLIEGADAQIRLVADADFDRLAGRRVPGNVWLTDTRDLDGYFFCEAGIEKLLKLALGECVADPRRILVAVFEACRPLGLLRFVSNEENLNLPFQETKIQKVIVWDLLQWRVDVDVQKHVQTLLQNAGISLRDARRILNSLAAAIERFRDVAHYEIVHGKDAIRVIAELLNEYQLPRDFAFHALRPTFERSYAEAWPTLQAVLAFLRA